MAKKKKVRVALKKNRQKRTRANDLTRTYEGDAASPGPQSAPGPSASDAASNERVRAKGDLSRYRTILTEETDDESKARSGDASQDAASLRAVDASNSLRGRVVRVHGLVSIVEAEAGGTFPCHVRRLLKSLAIDGRNVVAVGDQVWFRPAGRPGEDGLIEKVEPRGGVINRGYRNRRHVIAANVDTVLVVASMAEPPLKLGLVDRYLVASEIGGVRPVIVLNKADLVDVGPFQWVSGLYTQLGYETLITSAADGRGIDRLKELMASGVTAVSGQSGVGKSSLLNAIQPGLNLKVREVSDWTSKGKHTTTAAELIRLQAGGYVMDTPGLRQFELWGAPPGELEGHFVEFRPYIPLCRFPDCTHTHEGRCAVKDAVHWGQIHLGRYESYRRLFEQRPLDVD